ncbi:hypothetical protein FACS18942_09550 [Planctomycetales bacterium]|nr:hypothetical protein FACS18942_09550 [Planctomycetales bacterium]
MKRRTFVKSLLTLAGMPVLSFAAESADSSTEKSKDAKEVKFFDAKEEGLIEASIVMKSSLDGRVSIKNKSGQPLRIELPATFAAVHVAQFGDDMGGGAGGGRSRGGGGGSGGGNQAAGGGMGGMGGMSGGMGGGMGMMNLAPEQVVRHNVKTVCLEHGKKDPKHHLHYEIRPLETVTDKGEVQVLCSMVGAGAVDQKSAQAAVWHYNNGLSWEELAAKQYKPRIDSSYTVPYFSGKQMVYAINLGKKVEEKVAAENKPGQKSSSDYFLEK